MERKQNRIKRKRKLKEKKEASNAQQLEMDG
jgi:hypothetical protein